MVGKAGEHCFDIGCRFSLDGLGERIVCRRRRHGVILDQPCLLSRLLLLPLLVDGVMPDNRANPTDELCSAVTFEGRKALPDIDGAFLNEVGEAALCRVRLPRLLGGDELEIAVDGTEELVERLWAASASRLNQLRVSGLPWGPRAIAVEIRRALWCHASSSHGLPRDPRGRLPHPRASPLGWGGKNCFLGASPVRRPALALSFRKAVRWHGVRARGWRIAAVWQAVASAGFPAAFFATGINAPPGSRLSWHPRSRKHLHRRSRAKRRLNQASRKQHVNRSRFLRRKVIGKNPMVGVKWLWNDQQVPCPGAPACSLPCSTLGT